MLRNCRKEDKTRHNPSPIGKTEVADSSDRCTMHANILTHNLSVRNSSTKSRSTNH